MYKIKIPISSKIPEEMGKIIKQMLTVLIQPIRPWKKLNYFGGIALETNRNSP